MKNNFLKKGKNICRVVSGAVIFTLVIGTADVTVSASEDKKTDSDSIVALEQTDNSSTSKELVKTVENKAANVAKTKEVTVVDGINIKNLGINVKSCVNVRSKASTSSKVVGKMYEGASADIVSTSKDWYKVKSGNVTGYVSKPLLVTDNSQVSKLVKKYAVKKACVTASKLNVRGSKSTSAKIVTKLAKNTVSNVVEDKDDKWLKISKDTKKGYVVRQYVKVKKELKTATACAESTTSNKVTGEDIVEYALKFLGNKYVYGGTSLTNGIDCSGFTQAIYKKFGYSLPRTSSQQAASAGRVVSTSLSSLQKGDLLFYTGHVAIYIGNGRIVHASNPKGGIKTSSYNYVTPYRARRILN